MKGQKGKKRLIYGIKKPEEVDEYVI